MQLPQLRQRLRDLGAAPCHEGRVLRAWVQGRSLDTKRRRAEDFLPLAVRNDLPGLFDELNALAHVHSEHPGEDGSARLLVELADGQTVESVLLPRDGVCVSTQVGCKQPGTDHGFEPNSINLSLRGIHAAPCPTGFAERN